MVDLEMLRDQLPYRINQIQCAVQLVLFGLLVRSNARWWGARLGRGVLFYGRTFFQRQPGGRIVVGDRCVFRSSFASNTIGLKQRCFLSVTRSGELQIGNDCGFSGTVIAAGERIIIGDRVLCGANVTICDGDRHSLQAAARAQGQSGELRAIEIGNDVWLGMNVVVLKDVSIGAGAVVAANSVVTRDIPANCVAGGVPARIIRDCNGNDRARG